MFFVDSQPVATQQANPNSEAQVQLFAPDTEKRQPLQMPPGLIKLDFENLRAFEPINDHYRNLGVRFSGAIALHPSNPAFAPHSGSQVLIPVANLTGITVEFPKPVVRAGAFVLGSNAVILNAYDTENNLLQKINTEVNYQTRTEHNEPMPLPYQCLQINGSNIAKIIFFSAAPFIIDDFFFKIHLDTKGES